MRILVADDDRVLSQMLCSVLRQSGHKPTPAFDAVMALMAAKRAPFPELVLLDIGMPGGSGISTLTAIKNSSKTNEIPIIVISGSLDPDMADKVKGLGAARYIEKPVDPSMLLQIIREVCEESGLSG